MKQEPSEDEEEADGDAEQVIDYDALDAVDEEEAPVKTEFKSEDGDEEVSFDIENCYGSGD
jgi:hypothetical protein